MLENRTDTGPFLLIFVDQSDDGLTKAAIEAGRRVNYEGASSRLSFDQYGDVTPDFSLSEIDGGAFVRKGVVSF